MDPLPPLVNWSQLPAKEFTDETQAVQLCGSEPPLSLSETCLPPPPPCYLEEERLPGDLDLEREYAAWGQCLHCGEGLDRERSLWNR